MITTNRPAGKWITENGNVITADPSNLYRYVGNHPTNATDPTGLYEKDIHYYMTYYLAAAVGLNKDTATFLDDTKIGDPKNPRTDAKVHPQRGGKNVSAAFAIAWGAQFVDDYRGTSPVCVTNVVDGDAAFWHFYGVVARVETFKDRVEILKLLKELELKPGLTGLLKTSFAVPVQANSGEVKTLVSNAAVFKDDLALGMSLHTFEDSWSHEGFMMPKGHAGTKYGGHVPDYPWAEPGRALQMAEQVYKRLAAYREAMYGKGAAMSWEQIEPQVRKLMHVQSDFGASDNTKWEKGDPKFTKQDTEYRIEAWKGAIKERFKEDAPLYENNGTKDEWAKSFGIRAQMLRTPFPYLQDLKDYYPVFKDALVLL